MVARSHLHSIKSTWLFSFMAVYSMSVTLFFLISNDLEHSLHHWTVGLSQETPQDMNLTYDNLVTVSTNKEYLLPKGSPFIQSSTANCSFSRDLSDTDVILSTDVMDFTLYTRTDQLHGLVQLSKERKIPFGSVFNADLDISWTNSHLNFTGKLNSTVFEKMIMGLEVDRNSSLLLPTFFHDLCDLAKYRLDSVRCMNDYLNNVTLHHLDERFNTTGKWPFIDQVFVLHYKKKPERLNHMRDLLYQFNVSSKVIKDFDRDELTQDIIECAYPVNRTIDSRNWQPKNLSTGEISLSLKHFAAFDYIIKNKIEYALIFEDDVVIEGNLTSFDKSFRNAMLDLPADYDLYFVGGCLDLHCKAVTGTLDAPKACPQNNRSRCTHAYVISYRGALKMVKNLPIRWAIDWLMNSEGIGLKIYHAEPPLFLQGKSFESTGIRQGVET